MSGRRWRRIGDLGGYATGTVAAGGDIMPMMDRWIVTAWHGGHGQQWTRASIEAGKRAVERWLARKGSRP